LPVFEDALHGLHKFDDSEITAHARMVAAKRLILLKASTFWMSLSELSGLWRILCRYSGVTGVTSNGVMPGLIYTPQLDSWSMEMARVHTESPDVQLIGLGILVPVEVLVFGLNLGEIWDEEEAV
jgi:hypothetical protein